MNFFKYLFSISFLSLYLHNHAFGENLLEIYQLAAEKNPTLNQQRELFFIALDNLPDAKMKFFPSLSAYGTSNHNKIIKPKTNNQVVSSDEIILQISQPLVNLQLWLNYKYVDLMSKITSLQLGSAEQKLLLDIIKAYFKILKARNQLKFAQGQRNAFTQSLSQAQQKLQLGLLAGVDLEQAKALFDGAHALEIEALNDLQNEKEALENLTLCPIHAFPDLAQNEVKVNLTQPIQFWLNKTKLQNFSIMIERIKIQIAKHKIKITSAQNLPKLNLQANWSRGNLNNPNNMRLNRQTTILSLNVPLFNAGASPFALRADKRAYDAALFNYESITQAQLVATRKSYRGIQSLVNKIKALEQSLASNLLALKLTKAAHTVGTKNIVDVLNAQTMSLQAKKELANGKYDLIIEEANLKLLAGLLSIDDLKNINRWLN